MEAIPLVIIGFVIMAITGVVIYLTVSSSLMKKSIAELDNSQKASKKDTDGTVADLKTSNANRDSDLLQRIQTVDRDTGRLSSTLDDTKKTLGQGLDGVSTDIGALKINTSKIKSDTNIRLVHQEALLDAQFNTLRDQSKSINQSMDWTVGLEQTFQEQTTAQNNYNVKEREYMRALIEQEVQDAVNYSAGADTLLSSTLASRIQAVQSNLFNTITDESTAVAAKAANALAIVDQESVARDITLGDQYKTLDNQIAGYKTAFATNAVTSETVTSTKGIYARSKPSDAGFDAPLLAAQTDGAPGASFKGMGLWSHFPDADGNTKVRAGSSMTDVWIGDQGSNVYLGAPGKNVIVNGKLVTNNSINLFSPEDNNYGIYSASLAGKSIGGGAPGDAGLSQRAVRFSTADGDQNGFIFENSSGKGLASIRGSDGRTFVAGSLGVGTWNPKDSLHVVGGAIVDDKLRVANGITVGPGLSGTGKNSAPNGVNITSANPGPMLEKSYGTPDNRYGVGQFADGSVRLYGSSAANGAGANATGSVRAGFAKADGSFNDVLLIDNQGNVTVRGNIIQCDTQGANCKAVVTA